jgi:chromosome segregation ATPase
MLFPKENQNMSDPAPNQPNPVYINTNSGSGVKIPILFGAILALIGASVYLFYQLNQVKTELAHTRESILDEVSKMKETSTVTTQTSRTKMEKLEKDVQHDLDRTRAQAAQLSGQAKADAEHHAEELAAKLQKIQDDQGKQIAGVSSEVTQAKTDLSAANSKIEGVNTEVGGVKTDLAKNKAETEKLISQMKSAQGDLGVQSGLIATNGKELAALRELGERNYVEFKIAKSKAPQKIGDISVLLKNVDVKKNKYTIELIADDKQTEKKDRSLNEPVQFMMSRARQPYELVVNDIKKDVIAGYVAVPKVQQPRNSGSN